jgi:dihydroorotate dehydrogenase subfamily 2
MEIMYEQVLKPILFRFNPETVHDFFTNFGEIMGRTGFTRGLVDSLYGYHGRDVSRVVDGLRYRTPFILSAGFDYNARLTRILPAIGLGGVEVGSVTARPCAGNPKPRLTRLPRSQSILVNKGLRNEGVEAIIKRLKPLPKTPGFVVGVSIARTNDAEAASVEAGIADYFYSYKRLNEEGVGDYYTINISCPNAFGGETFATPELLGQLLAKLRTITSAKPLYLKLPINLAWEKIDELIKVGLNYKINGVVIGNLNKNYDDLEHRAEAPAQYRGGLSGKPCRELSTALIRQTKQKYGDQLTIIGCGGVQSPAEAKEKFAAGAELIELITGLIYKGPGLIKKLAAAQ